jgi:hypothetical protein
MQACPKSVKLIGGNAWGVAFSDRSVVSSPHPDDKPRVLR